MKRYAVYLIRWQLSTIILAPCIKYLSNLGFVWATIIANLIGGLIFFWIDRYIFYHNVKFPMWEVKESTSCFDCGQEGRGYRLVRARGYDKTDDPEPEFRCEQCSIAKYERNQRVGQIIRRL